MKIFIGCLPIITHDIFSWPYYPYLRNTSTLAKPLMGIPEGTKWVRATRAPIMTSHVASNQQRAFVGREGESLLNTQKNKERERERATETDSTPFHFSLSSVSVSVSVSGFASSLSWSIDPKSTKVRVPLPYHFLFFFYQLAFPFSYYNC